MRTLVCDTMEFGRQAFRMVIILMLLQWRHTLGNVSFGPCIFVLRRNTRQRKEARERERTNGRKQRYKEII